MTWRLKNGVGRSENRGLKMEERETIELKTKNVLRLRTATGTSIRNRSFGFVQQPVSDFKIFSGLDHYTVGVKLL